MSIAAQPQLSPLCTSSSDEDISTDDNLSHTATVDINSQPPSCSSVEESTCTECDQGKKKRRSRNFKHFANYFCIKKGARPAAAEDVISAPGEDSPAEEVVVDPQPVRPSVIQRVGRVTPAARTPSPSPSYSADDESSNYSSDEESAEHRRLLDVLRTFTVSRLPVVQHIRRRAEVGDTSSAAAIAAFYTRSPTPRERQNHRIEDGTRLVYESFDENNVVDRRVNEGKILYFLLVGVNDVRAVSKKFCYNFSPAQIRKYGGASSYARSKLHANVYAKGGKLSPRARIAVVI